MIDSFGEDLDSRAHQLLRKALDEPDVTRRAFVDSACGDDVALRSKTHRLLDSVAKSGQFLETPAWMPVDRGPDLVSRTIGEFSVLARAGAGGMGEVFKAEQRNPKRIVALKVIRGERPSPRTLARFSLETEALGRLQHPHVAQVIAAGTFAPDQTGGRDPLPYVAMEWIEGARSLGAYAVEQQLTLRARLDLFLKVTDAVSHAHGRGVIHRDLKTANVLVDAGGVVKVIDFGIALLADAGRHATLEGQFVGSLASMSPEQCTGGAIDVRSDVYSLGALLFELVEGHVPFDLAATPIAEAIDIIRTRVAPTADSGGEDLATVIATALAKQPDDRYASVEALARDVTNVLMHRPIDAKRPGLARRIRLFTRRHRSGVAAATLISIALIVASVGVLTSLVRAQNAEAETAKRIAELSRVSSFLRSLIANDGYDRGQATRTIASELDNWAKRIEKEFVDMPAARGMLRREVGRNLMAMGRYAEARVVLEASLADFVLVGGTESTESLTTRTTLARLTRDEGRPTEALALYESLVADMDRVLPESPIEGDIARSDFAMLLHSLKRSDEAAAILERVLNNRLAKLGRDNIRTAATIGQLGRIRFGQGNDEEAERLYREAIEIEARIADGGPLASASTRNNLAIVLRRMGREAEAIEILKDLLALRTREQGADSPETLTVQSNLGMSLLATGDRVAAVATLSDAYAAHCRVLGSSHRGTTITGLILLRALVESAAWSDAATLAPTLRASLEAAQPQFGTSTWRPAWCDCLFGRALIGMGDTEAGRALLQKGIGGLEAAPVEPESAKSLATAKSWLAASFAEPENVKADGGTSVGSTQGNPEPKR
jgi:eukaryotic-like serine/threonine-protein kinase